MSFFSCLLEFAKENIAFVKDFATTLAAFSAIWFGFNGLNTWKRQLQGNNEYVLAKNMLAALYELRGVIDSARNGSQCYYSDLSAEELDKLKQNERQWLIISGTYNKRWDIIKASEAKLQSNLIEAEVIWGKIILEKIKPLTSLIKELLSAMNEVCIDDFNRTFNPSERSEEDRARIKKLKKVLYKDFFEEDEFMNRLEKIILDIENDLKPHILQYHKSRSHKR